MDVSFRQEESPKAPGRRWLLSQVLKDGLDFSWRGWMAEACQMMGTTWQRR